MAKTKNELIGPGFSGFSRMRGTIRAPKSKELSDYLWYLPPAGVVDLRNHDDHQPLSLGEVAAVAPLSAVTESAEQALELRGQLIRRVSRELADNLSFLPQRFQNQEPDSAAVVNGPSIAVVDRQRQESGEPSVNLDQLPLEVVVRERYVPVDSKGHHDRGFGVGHYVYDPLTARWLIIQRWARGQNKKRTGEIEPYVQLGASRRRFRQAVNELEAEPLPAAEIDNLAGEEQIKNSYRKWRQRNAPPPE